MRVCICGGGSLGNVIAVWTAARRFADVDIFTGRPEKWSHTVTAATPEGETLRAEIDAISSDPAIVSDADVVLLCYPGYLIEKALKSVSPYLRPDAYVGAVFSSTGFFFEARRILRPSQPLWGFQRVPFIARVREYGHSAELLGYKTELNVAVENVPEEEKTAFVQTLSRWFDRPVHLLANYYEATLSNSNPLLHPARLYTMFGGENTGKAWDSCPFFYQEWTNEASELLIAMDEEFFGLLDVLPVTPGFLPRILDYYESHDAASLTSKISSIKAFQGIRSPMAQGPDGLWRPDFASRYFTEDFPYGMRFIYNLAHEHGIEIPVIDRVYNWGMSLIQQ